MHERLTSSKWGDIMLLTKKTEVIGMGKFDGMLICSDWDGTLFYKGNIPDESLEAIRYFQENGGIFTICSGRPPAYLKRHKHLVNPNTYALCLNGACVCDLDTGKIIEEGFVGDEAYDLVDTLLESGAKIKSVNAMIAGNEEMVFMPIEEYKAKKFELKATRIYKLTLSGIDENDGETMRSAAASFNPQKHCAERSFHTYIEILNREYTKGASARKLKERLGAKLLVGMGDYENDISLIKAADIGYAVENAAIDVKNMADRITVRVDEAAVAKIISDLEHSIN